MSDRRDSNITDPRSGRLSEPSRIVGGPRSRYSLSDKQDEVALYASLPFNKLIDRRVYRARVAVDRVLPRAYFLSSLTAANRESEVHRLPCDEFHNRPMNVLKCHVAMTSMPTVVVPVKHARGAGQDNSWASAAASSGVGFSATS